MGVTSVSAKLKAAKKQSNIIATFSDKDIFEELPSSKDVSASIPSHLILKKVNKLKADKDNVKSRDLDQKSKTLNINNEPTIQDRKDQAKGKTSKIKIKTTEIDDAGNLSTKLPRPKKDSRAKEEMHFLDGNRKSKNMQDGDDYEYVADSNVNVISDPSIVHLSASFSNFDISTPTALPIPNSPTKTSIFEGFKIAQSLHYSSIVSLATSMTTPKNRKFTPISKMNLKRLESSSDQGTPLNFARIIFILILSIIINQV